MHRMRIPADAATISAHRTGPGGLVLTYPRAGRAALAAVLLAAGLALWLWQMPPGGWRDPAQYAFGLVVLAPGLGAAEWAARRRAVVRIEHGELAVAFGVPFFERTVTTLPLDSLEVRVEAEQVEGVQYDPEAVRKRSLAALGLGRGRLRKTEVPLYVVQVRTRGQSAWLGVLGSRAPSESENARLALEAVAAEVVPVQVEE